MASSRGGLLAELGVLPCPFPLAVPDKKSMRQQCRKQQQQQQQQQLKSLHRICITLLVLALCQWRPGLIKLNLAQLAGGRICGPAQCQFWTLGRTSSEEAEVVQYVVEHVDEAQQHSAERAVPVARRSKL